MRLFILVYLIVLCLAAPDIADPDLDVCGNPFLPKLQGAVRVFPNTVFGSFDHCQQEWNTEGTCCHEGDLVRFFKEETRSIRESVESTNKIFKGIHKVFIEFTNAMKEANISEKNEDQPEFTRKIEGFSHQEFFDDFERASDNCWNHMIAVRGSALCSICSGRGEDFFKGKKILIGMEDCKATVSACKKFFLDFDSLIVDLKIVAKDMKAESDFSIDKDVINLDRSVKKLKIPKDLVSSLKRFDSASPFNQNRLASSICYKIMDIRKQPVVTTVATTRTLHRSYRTLRGKGAFSIVKFLQGKGKSLLKFKWAKNLLKKSEAKLSKSGKSSQNSNGKSSKSSTGKSKSSNSAKSRRLDSDFEHEKKSQSRHFDLEADSLTIMRDSDNMFHSFEGSDGSPLSFACSYHKIMNLSVAFP